MGLRVENEAVVHGASLSVGVPTPEQAEKQRLWELEQGMKGKVASQMSDEELVIHQEAKRRAVEQAFELGRQAEAITPEQAERINIELTGSPRPNRAQRRAAEKRMRRQGRRG